MRNRQGGHWFFLGEFVRNARQTGALAPSSRWLARRMIASAAIGAQDRVVEIGPGTGAFTRHLVERLPPGPHQLLVVERNPRFCTMLQQRFPMHEVVLADACHLPELVHAHGWDRVERVISGLPWAAFDADLQQALLTAVTQVLAPTGRLVTFAYWGAHQLPKGRRFRARLEARFQQVRTTSVVLRNFPPAFVYIADGPHPTPREWPASQ